MRSLIRLCSQLMSPHGMHLVSLINCLKLLDSQLMSPHGMHRDIVENVVNYVTPNSCLRTECIHIRSSFLTIQHSQLMSPHGMHRPLKPEAICRLSPNSCLRTECIPGIGGARFVTQAPNSCLRTECIMVPSVNSLHRIDSQLMSPHGMHPPSPAS